MTQLDGPRSGDLVRAWRRHQASSRTSQNADCIVIMGSNMAECHPVGFQWVMEAKLRGAKIVHVDPRFTRTSALASSYVPIRAGSDIAFLGGIVNHILQNGREFRDYVVNYTNAPVIINEGFKDTEDLDGFFSGWDAEKGGYDNTTWQYAGMRVRGAVQDEETALSGEAVGFGGHGAGLEHGEPPEEDPTLEHPRCVFQLLKRHYSRYTPELRRRDLRLLEGAVPRGRGGAVRELRPRAHVGVLLRGRLDAAHDRRADHSHRGDRPAAARQHGPHRRRDHGPARARLDPGLDRHPDAVQHPARLHPDGARARQADAGGVRREERLPDRLVGGDLDAYMVSLLKAYFGARRPPENDFCFDYLPRIDGDHSTYQAALGMLEGNVKGFFLLGENPAVGSANSRLHRMAMANLDWLVVRDLVEIESASFWHDAPELETGELKTDEIATEVFFLPAASHVEKNGSFTNTQRLLQWHFKAVEPSGDCRSDLWFVYHLGLRVREKLAGSDDPRDRPLLDLEWHYPTEGPLEDPSADAVLREISGWDENGRAVSSFAELKPDGSTVCGCWIYSGCYADEVNQPARKKPGQEQSWVAPEWGWAWPSNRRILYNRASADPSGRPWSERKRYVWWDEQQGRWIGHDVPDFAADKPPDYVPPTGAKADDGDPRRPPVHHAGRRARLAVRPQRARRRPDSRRTSSRRSRLSETRSTASRPTPRASSFATALSPFNPTAGEPEPMRTLRAHDLPADRAPHRRRA